MDRRWSTDDLLIASRDGTDRQFVVALDKHTGEIRWKSDRNGNQAYTRRAIQGARQRPGHQHRRAAAAMGYEPLTGKEIWSVSYGDGYSQCSTPVTGTDWCSSAPDTNTRRFRQ